MLCITLGTCDAVFLFFQCYMLSWLHECMCLQFSARHHSQWQAHKLNKHREYTLRQSTASTKPTPHHSPCPRELLWPVSHPSPHSPSIFNGTMPHAAKRTSFRLTIQRLGTANCNGIKGSPASAFCSTEPVVRQWLFVAHQHMRSFHSSAVKLDRLTRSFSALPFCLVASSFSITRLISCCHHLQPSTDKLLL